jgi:uncharacterized membrane protein YfcA
MEVFGFAAAIVIGISLGLIGGGGSILTVPVLFYIFHLNTELATSYSLFIVGATSLVGSVACYRAGLVNVRTAIVFGIPSIIAVFLTRKFLIPAIPEVMFSIGNLTITKDLFLLLLFALLMIAASYSMIQKSKEITEETDRIQVFNYPLILLEGTVVGVLTGLVGAGGGFLIIPALVTLSKLPMKQAIGTSLVIIAAKSLIGFFGESSLSSIHWNFLLTFTGFSIIGIFIGNALSVKVKGEQLKPAFGWFVLVMGCYIIVHELFFKN